MKSEPLKKIIYFDESSAVDLLQIEKKGNFTRTQKLVNNLSGGAGAEASVKAEADTDKGKVANFISKSAGLSGGIKGMLDGSGHFKGERIITTLIENSLLYDFLDTVEIKRRKMIIDITNLFALSINKDSMTYYATIAPITEIMAGNQQIPDSEFTMEISKINKGLRDLKGYYELIGKDDHDTTRIFRFNIDAFRNNYRIQDLPKMKLKLYSIKVGKTSISQISMDNEFDTSSSNNAFNYSVMDKNNDNSQDDDLIPVFDVILAGIE